MLFVLCCSFSCRVAFRFVNSTALRLSLYWWLGHYYSSNFLKPNLLFALAFSVWLVTIMITCIPNWLRYRCRKSIGFVSPGIYVFTEISASLLFHSCLNMINYIFWYYFLWISWILNEVSEIFYDFILFQHMISIVHVMLT